MYVRGIFSPTKYYQGNGLLESLCPYISFIGKRFAVITDDLVYRLCKDKLDISFKGNNSQWYYIPFGGESTMEEGKRIAEIVYRNTTDGIIGLGGGKAIDSAKLAANLTGLPIVVIPTTASTDAPCSSMSVVYDKAGNYIQSIKMRTNPDVVLVDTGVIAKAPVRTLISGMGDGLSTFYEARACKVSGTLNFASIFGCEAAYTLAKLCNDLILEYGIAAKKTVEKGEWSEPLEKIVEANIYLSGLGFENNGLAIAHGVYNGLSSICKPLHALHGECVAYGTLVQLAAEGAPDKEWKPLVNFYKAVGLPLSLDALGIPSADGVFLKKIAEAICTVSQHPHHMPFLVTSETILLAIKTVKRRLEA